LRLRRVVSRLTAIPDHFSLFGLEPRFALNQQHLMRAYRTVQAHVHPDRHAASGAAEQRAALQWATLANEAYQVLSSPVRRAAYLCERNGVTVSGDSGATLAPDFLALQLEWRRRWRRSGTSTTASASRSCAAKPRPTGNRGCGAWNRRSMWSMISRVPPTACGA